MKYKNLNYETEEEKGFITIDRQEVLNALNGKTLDELNDVLNDIEDDDNIEIVIITGAGKKAFAAGADISEIHDLDAVEGKEFARKGQSVFNRIERLEKPVIAAVNGYAFGGGCELALACPLRIASDKAVFDLPETSLGLIPGYGGTQRLSRTVGKSRALDIILTDKKIKAGEAKRLGIVSRTVSEDELIDKAVEMGDEILNRGPLAVKYALEAVNTGSDMPLEEGLYLEANLFGLACGTEDMKEGTKAFQEKRKPDFKGQ